MNKGTEGVVGGDGDDGIGKRDWTPFIEYTAYSFPTVPPMGDLDCLHVLHLSFHELQLLRLETRPLERSSRHGGGAYEGRGRRRRSRRQFRSELLLGDIHTEKVMRNRYRPTALQPYSLFKAKKVRKTVTGFAISMSFHRVVIVFVTEAYTEQSFNWIQGFLMHLLQTMI